VTAGDTALLAMELDQYGAGSFNLHASCMQVRLLRLEVERLAEEIALIGTELEQRSSP
jgi:hypothetical protein